MPIVVPQSASIKISQEPEARLPYVRDAKPPPAMYSAGYMLFTCKGLIADGKCTIAGLTTDNPAGWTLGMIQLQWIQTDWAYYRGQTNLHGDSFLQFARPPARSTQVCRDTVKPGAIFADLDPVNGRTIARAGAPFPIEMKAQLRDKPMFNYQLTHKNKDTGMPNFLSEAQIDFHFCTVLSLRKPEPRQEPIAETYIHLKHFFWNLRWQARFQPGNYGDLTKPWTITPIELKADVSDVIYDGGPTDEKFTRSITDEATPNCMVLANNARSLVKARYSRTWTNHNVRH